MITSNDWKIHKILDEAKRVYIYPARGNNKHYTQLELYADLMAQNKNIRVIRAEDVKKAVDKLKSEPVLDYDLVDIFEETHRHRLFGDYLHERYNDFSLKPVVRPDVFIPYAYPIDDSDILEDNDHWLKQNPWLKDKEESE